MLCTRNEKLKTICIGKEEAFPRAEKSYLDLECAALYPFVAFTTHLLFNGFNSRNGLSIHYEKEKYTFKAKHTCPRSVGYVCNFPTRMNSSLHFQAKMNIHTSPFFRRRSCQALILLLLPWIHLEYVIIQGAVVEKMYSIQRFDIQIESFCLKNA